MIVNGKSLLRAAPIVNMLDKKVVHSNGLSYGLAESGYDIRIKQEVHYYPPTVNHPLGLVITRDGAYDLRKHGSFTLASSVEQFNMPTDLVGKVLDKSTYARQGLSLFNTNIEPNWRGFLTLELRFCGYDEVHIPAGSPIAQIMFEELTDAASYNGKYQDQLDMPVKAVFE